MNMQTVERTTAGRSLDPVTFSVIWGGLLSAAAEMGVTLMRTAYSVAVREGSDFSTGVFDSHGNIVAQGDYSPGHLGSMAFAVRQMLADFPREELEPGDAIVCNDPGIGSGHLPDLYMVYPIFLGRDLLGFAVNIAHHIDTGGAGSGSQAITGIIDNFQEGIRILPTKLYIGGEPVKEIFRIIEANVRVPEVIGDIRAQYAANISAAKRIQELGQQYGPDLLAQAMEELLQRSEEQMRAALRELKQGVFKFEDMMDDVGPDTEPVKACVTITIADGEIEVDWEGSGPQREAGMNSYLNYTASYAIAAVKSVTLPAVPQNHGIIKCIKVKAPLGCFFNPRRPAASGGRAVNSHRIYEVTMGGLAQSVPDRVIAASSHFYNPNFGGINPATGASFICWESIIGGVGARSNKDGIEATSSPWNGTNVPVEIQESRNPILIERFGLIPDSAGAGRYRGGCGVRRDLRVLADNVNFYNLGDRNLKGPYGLRGGAPGKKGITLLNPGSGEERALHSKGTYKLRKSDLVSWRTAGAGGYGPAEERSIDMVVRDVREGLVSPGAAASEYGVVISAGGDVDMAATDKLRAKMRQSRTVEERVVNAD